MNPTNTIPTTTLPEGMHSCLSSDVSKIDVSPDQFRHFYLAKAYDVIGAGTFRRHLCRCKEAGDPWAVEMNSGVNAVHQAVRQIQTRISQIPRPRHALLQQLCRDVMVGAQPPIRMYAGYTTCCLSGVSCNTCIDLTRPSKNAQHVHIHARFSHFFLMLWYCSKLEYVIRSCAKAWLERQNEREESNFKSLCEQFKDETDDFCLSLHGVFARSFVHVNRTLDVLMHYSLEHKVLETPVVTSTDQDKHSISTHKVPGKDEADSVDGLFKQQGTT